LERFSQKESNLPMWWENRAARNSWARVEGKIPEPDSDDEADATFPVCADNLNKKLDAVWDAKDAAMDDVLSGDSIAPQELLNQVGSLLDMSATGVRYVLYIYEHWRSLDRRSGNGCKSPVTPLCSSCGDSSSIISRPAGFRPARLVAVQNGSRYGPAHSRGPWDLIPVGANMVRFLPLPA
jgi:hypothetical protein